MVIEAERSYLSSTCTSFSYALVMGIRARLMPSDLIRAFWRGAPDNWISLYVSVIIFIFCLIPHLCDI